MRTYFGRDSIMYNLLNSTASTDRAFFFDRDMMMRKSSHGERHHLCPKRNQNIDRIPETARNGIDAFCRSPSCPIMVSQSPQKMKGHETNTAWHRQIRTNEIPSMAWSPQKMFSLSSSTFSATLSFLLGIRSKASFASLHFCLQGRKK